MTRTQFRVLYREFLFRVVDRELLSTYAQGDMSKLLLRFVSLLIFMGFIYAAPAALIPRSTSAQATLLMGFRTIDALIATTMLTVGLCTVLSWTRCGRTRAARGAEPVVAVAVLQCALDHR